MTSLASLNSVESARPLLSKDQLPAHIVPLLATVHLLVIIASNYLVQMPVDLGPIPTTWGAFTFPICFLATDLTVRALGQVSARKVVAAVMLPALIATYVVSVLFFEAKFQGWEGLSTVNTFVLRITLASLMAFLVGQIVDIAIFARLVGRQPWWLAPAVSTLIGGALDTVIFFAVAFYQSSDAYMAAHWPVLALTDYATKQFVALLAYLPLYAVMLRAFQKYLGLTHRA